MTIDKLKDPNILVSEIIKIISDARYVEWVKFDFDSLAIICHAMSRAKGFHDRDVPFPEFIALCHSELSEALEGNRKDNKSDKIPLFTAEEEELADLLIRVFDRQGKDGLRLGEAVIAKLIYNGQREHMHGGKKY